MRTQLTTRVYARVAAVCGEPVKYLSALSTYRTALCTCGCGEGAGGRRGRVCEAEAFKTLLRELRQHKTVLRSLKSWGRRTASLELFLDRTV